MKRLMFLALLLSLGLTACKTTQTTIASPTDKPAPKTELEVGTATPGTLKFFAKNARYSAEGGFEKWHFTKVNVPNMQTKDASGLTASLIVETTSVTEKAEGLQKHLLQDDFLAAEKNPKATIDIKDVTKVEGNQYKGTAVVKIKDLTGEYPVSFELTIEKAWHVKGEVMILRKVFGLGEGNDNIENEVKVTFDTDLK
jgi:polyisoprenoid-binding protein YceI